MDLFSATQSERHCICLSLSFSSTSPSTFPIVRRLAPDDLAPNRCCASIRRQLWGAEAIPRFLQDLHNDKSGTNSCLLHMHGQLCCSVGAVDRFLEFRSCHTHTYLSAEGTVALKTDQTSCEQPSSVSFQYALVAQIERKHSFFSLAYSFRLNS
mmetsp:Transcript_96747/g.153100  ORF Transcript_96747/g.153100 Transcript_96747/m.153100 type:complete len:154 (-) Transcript_96747:159-620(-)